MGLNKMVMLWNNGEEIFEYISERG